MSEGYESFNGFLPKDCSGNGVSACIIIVRIDEEALFSAVSYSKYIISLFSKAATCQKVRKNTTTITHFC